MSTGAQPETTDAGLLSRSIVPALAVLFCLGLTATYFQLQRNHDILIRRTAEQHAAVYSHTLDRFRELYATEVVETARKMDVRVTHDYLTEPNAIPLPITLSRQFEANPPAGVKTLMYSPFPFEFPNEPVRKGLPDKFAEDAWKSLSDDPQTPFSRVEQMDGVPTLRYAIAEQMKEGCVTCHNDYVGSPKTDWQVGDVRGVLEVAYPLNQAASLAEGSIWETLGTLTPMMLLALVLLGITTRKHRNAMEALHNRMRAQERAQRTAAENENLRSRIGAQHDELLKSRIELLGNEHRVMQILESMPLGVLKIDRDGATKYANQHAVDLLGEEGVFSERWIDAEELWFYPMTGEPYPVDALPAARALRGESTAAMQVEIHRNNQSIPAMVSGAPIYDAEGNVCFALVVVQDVTDEQRMAQQVRQAQRMQAMGRLAGGVAHDFNNVLTAIKGFGEYALEEIPQESEAHGDVQQMLDAAERGATLTAQLLSFARRAALNDNIIEPNVAIESMGQLLQRLVGDDVSIDTNLAGDLPNVRLGAGAFDQMLINFAVNAKDAMPDGGSFEIETMCVQLDEEHVRRLGLEIVPGEYVCLRVSDSGTGMDDDTRRQMFEPFFTTKVHGKGTGLGLSTCWGIARNAGGYIDVDSELGRGTTLSVFLPAIHDTVSEASQRKEAPRRTTATILVAEDDDVVRDLIVRTLRRAGYEVIDASDGQKAWERINAEPAGTVDLVLTDVMMPNMNGGELGRRLAKEFPDIRVIYMSGYTDDAILDAGVLRSSVTLLHKPTDVSPEVLLAKVKDTLNIHTHESHPPQ